jgi:hypothetical protein
MRARRDEKFRNVKGKQPMKRLCSLCFVMTVLLPCLAMGDASPIGKIKTCKGEVVIIHSDEEIAVKTGDKLFRNDIIQTGIEFRMTWKSDAATHIDIYTAKQWLSDPMYAVWGQKQ